MTELLSKIREIFGQNLDQGKIQEALQYPSNKSLAKIGNDVLDLCNSLIMYDEGYFSSQIDGVRQILFSRDNHREIINSDKDFVEYSCNEF